MAVPSPSTLSFQRPAAADPAVSFAVGMVALVAAAAVLAGFFSLGIAGVVGLTAGMVVLPAVAGGSPRGREPMASSNSHRPEFLDRLADLVPPPRKHRHRYPGVFAPNHKLRRAVTALAMGNIGKRCDTAAGEHAGNAHATEGCCDAQAKPCPHDTSRIAWAKLLARVGERGAGRRTHRR